MKPYIIDSDDSFELEMLGEVRAGFPSLEIKLTFGERDLSFSLFGRLLIDIL